MARSFPRFAVNRTTTHAAVRLLCGHLAALCPAAAVVLLLPQQVDAAEWTVKPSLSLTENYSDNIRRAPRGNEQSDLITQISPGLNLTGTGPKLTFSTIYQMQNLFYAKNKQSDSTRHNLALTHTQSWSTISFFWMVSPRSANRTLALWVHRPLTTSTLPLTEPK